jgi:Ca2+-binding RTX toxin-like protein
MVPFADTILANTIWEVAMSRSFFSVSTPFSAVRIGPRGLDISTLFSSVHVRFGSIDISGPLGGVNINLGGIPNLSTAVGSTAVGAGSVLAGDSADNVFHGGRGADIIDGKGGADMINGLGGNDIIQGGAGDDTINPGAGSDIVDSGSGYDRIIIGADAVQAGEVDVIHVSSGDRLDFDAAREARLLIDAMSLDRLQGLTALPTELAAGRTTIARTDKGIVIDLDGDGAYHAGIDYLIILAQGAVVRYDGDAASFVIG